MPINRPFRIALIAAGSIVLLILIVIVAGVTVLRGPWFRDQIRSRIISEIEDATGGRAEIAGFDFDWSTLTATVRGFTLHGTEPAGDPPLLHADQIVVGLKIISLLKKDVDILMLRVDKPQAFLLVAADGTTNVPNPKTPRKSSKSSVETVLDLAIQHFELNQGVVQVASKNSGKAKTEPYSAKANNLRALFTFDAAVPRYHGDIALQPLDLAYGAYKPLPTVISTTLAIEKNKIVIEKADIRTGDSEFRLNGQLQDFNAPVFTAEYGGKLSIAQLGSVLKLPSRQSGWVELNGNATYKSADDFKVSSDVKAYDVDYRTNRFDVRRVSVHAKVNADPHLISSSDIRVTALGGQIAAKVELSDLERLKVSGNLHHFAVSQIAAFATNRQLPYDGSVSGGFALEGRLANLREGKLTATARLDISPSGQGVPVNGLIDAKYTGVGNVLDLHQSFVALPNTRLEFSGILGRQLNVHFASTNLNDLLPAMRAASTGAGLPVTMTPQGQVTFDGVVTGELRTPAIAGHLSGDHFVFQNQTIDALSADAVANQNSVSVNNGSIRWKSVMADVSATVGLHGWSPLDNDPVTARLALRSASLDDLLAVADQKNVPVSGALNATASIGGTIGTPRVTADATLTDGKLSGEPFDRLTARLTASNRLTQALAAQLDAGPKRVNIKATYTHGARDALPGDVTFEVASNTIAVNQVVLVRTREPDLAGSVKLTASGAARVFRDAKGNPAVALTKVDADAAVSDLQLADRRLGDLHLTAATAGQTGSTQQVEVKLRSNLATADIAGDGKWALEGDYPGTAKLQFTNVNLDTLRRIVLTPAQADSIQIGGGMEGTLDVRGPAAKPAELQADFVIPKLEIHPLASLSGAPAGIDLSIKNSEPIRATYKDGSVRIDSAHLVAQDSDISIRGRATITPRQDLNLRADGHMNLAILHLLNSDLVASGQVVLNAGVRGDFSDPQVNGTLALEKANLALADLPNGLSNASGTIQFTGNQATIQTLSGESGGGRVTFGGFAGLAGGILSFRVNANASGVRVRYPPGVSTVADAQLNLVGTSQRSILQGTVTVDRLAFNPKTDLGSLLSSASSPPETPSAAPGFASNLQFDVQIQTSPDITFESSLTQSVEAEANLRLRGTIQNPVLLGRINILQGDLTFFGNKYTINQGSVSFFNPVKLEPILNIDLETVAKGVDVTITVSGPISKLNVTYRSDPPLQFADIVGLLATGRVPNDATIAARQSTAPQQNWQQMGASALVGQVIANPVSGRLQRFFGVSQLKIDPTISGVTGNPQAKVTLQQQITPDITFTYITDVANSQEQVIRVEWAFSPTWSAVAVRDENGEFGMNFLYKKRFK